MELLAPAQKQFRALHDAIVGQISSLPFLFPPLLFQEATMFEGEFDTFGITLPVKTWRALLHLAGNHDRVPSDYLRMLIHRETEREMGSEGPLPQGVGREIPETARR